MKFVWEDYNYEKHCEIDKWKNKSYSENYNEVNKFAMFNEKLSKTAEWYKNNKLGDLKDFIKVVLFNGEIVAYVILNLCKIEGDKKQLGINPIVINPKMVSKGIGTKVLQEFIGNYDIIIKQRVDILYAGIDEDNKKSKKLFTSAGFILRRMDNKNSFGYYYLKI